MKHLENLITEMVDRRLDNLMVEDVKKHLEECEQCRNFFKMQAGLKNAMKNMPRKTAPPSLTERLNTAFSSNE